MSLSTNGTTILKSFAELGSAIDLATLPPGSSDMADATTPTTTAADSAPTEVLAAETALKPTPNLAMLLARLAEMSSGLEAMARQDAQAREQATLQLAQYETLAAERREVERALAEARQVRLVAEQFVAQAFSDELRAQAAEQVAAARAAQLTCAELLAERTRAADELASRPQLARVLADRRRQAQARAEREQQQAAERTQRLAAGIDQAGQALCQEVPDQALAILRPLSAEFPDQPEVRRLLGTAAWQGQRRLVAPAEEALRDVRSRVYRQDPELAMARLASVALGGVPEDLARQVFGIWSDVCLKVVRQRGWHDPQRYAPRTSRGVVFARETPEASLQVVNALGLPDWRVGEAVTSPGVLRAARALQEPKRTASTS